MSGIKFIELTTTEKISVLNRVVKIVEKNGIICMDAFSACLDAFVKTDAGERITGESYWIFTIRHYFPEVKNEATVMKHPHYRFRFDWMEKYTWLKKKEEKRQRIEFLKEIREIYIQKYLEKYKTSR
ncbi:MAG: hypothetical protein LBT24_04670 [Tannerella sp.]|jgi:hypothetical protein|nr:hypothetical protein [Tannerella sp.]